MLKTFSSEKINATKNALFFFRKLQLITVLLLICNPYMNSSTRSISLKKIFIKEIKVFAQRNAWNL